MECKLLKDATVGEQRSEITQYNYNHEAEQIRNPW